MRDRDAWGGGGGEEEEKDGKQKQVIEVVHKKSTHTNKHRKLKDISHAAQSYSLYN